MPNISKSIILGTAKMHHIWRRDKFNAIILEALNLGIEKFDIAPLYGGGTTQKRLIKVIKGTNATVNTKAGLKRISLTFESSLFEYWLRYLFFRLFRGKFDTEEDLSLISDCIKNSYSLHKNLVEINTLFIHEPPTFENDFSDSLIHNFINILIKFKDINHFKNIGIAGENVFLYKKFFNLGLLDVIQTSSSNLINTEESDIISCLNNCKRLNLYGIHYVNKKKLMNKLNNLFDNVDQLPKVSIIVSSTKPKYLFNRIKKAMSIVPF